MSTATIPAPPSVFKIVLFQPVPCKGTLETLKNLKEAGRKAVHVTTASEVEIKPGDLFIELDAPEKCVTESDLDIKEPGSINIAQCASIKDDDEEFETAVSEFTEILLAYDGNDVSLPQPNAS